MLNKVRQRLQRRVKKIFPDAYRVYVDYNYRYNQSRLYVSLYPPFGDCIAIYKADVADDLDQNQINDVLDNMLNDDIEGRIK